MLVYERFEGFGLEAALAPAALIVLVALAAFIALRVLLAVSRRRVARLRTAPAADGVADTVVRETPPGGEGGDDRA